MRFDGTLLDELQRRQRQLRESNEVFAARFGVSRETWRMIKLGRTGITGQTLGGIARAFPDLAEQARAFFVPPDMQ